MIAHNFSNLAVPMTITADMTSGQTTMVLSSLAGLPAYPYFLVVDRDTTDIEMVEVTGLNTGTTVNVVRGYGDTSPAAHTSGDSVLHVAPAEFFTEVLTDIATLGTDAGLKVKKLAARTTVTGNIANTETRVIGVTMPTSSLVTGTVIEFEAAGVFTNTTTASTSVWRIRVGPTTLTGAVCGSWSLVMGTTARTNVPFNLMGKLVVLSSTTAIATIVVSANTANTAVANLLNQPTTTVTAPVTIATNANQEVELTVISGAASTTWNALVAYQELVAA